MNKIPFYIFLLFLVIFSLIRIPPKAHSQIVYPNPWYSYSPNTPRVGDVMIFDASEFINQWNQTGQSTLLPLIWYFGDGESTTGTIVNHTYVNPGTYVLGVTATDERGYGSLHEKSLNVEEQTPVTVNIALSNKFIKTGQQVTIIGKLIHNRSCVQNEWITLSSTTYPFTQWNEIATVKTDEQGQYSFDWKAFYGYYHVKATWEGNSSYPESSISVVFIVESYGDLINEYESNSTITGMNYNATYNTLSFTAEGPSGTKGYTKIYIREDWKFDPDKVTVLFDGNPIEYEISQSEEVWILELNYNHSIHNIEVNFDQYSPFTLSTEPTLSESQGVEPVYLEIIIGSSIIVIGVLGAGIGFIVYLMKKN